MGKRADGEGTIFYSNSKKKWCCAIRLGVDANGKENKIQKFSNTQEEAKNKLRELVHKYNTLKLKKDLTLNSWYPEWVFEYIEVSNKTKQSYIGIWENHIKDYPIGKMKLSEITSFDIKKYFNQLSRDGRSRQRIIAIKHRLTTMFNDSQEYIVRNPMIGVQIPNDAADASRSYSKDAELSNDEGEYNAFTVDEQQVLLEYLLSDPLDTFNLLFITFLGTGMRLGEALVLNYKKDVNEDYTEISITRNLQRVPIFENRKVIGYELQELPPKSTAGIRKIHLPEILTTYLRKAHLEQRLKARVDPGYVDNSLVFADEMGMYIEAKKPLRKLKALEKKLDLSPVNIHGLRHTFATRLFEVGEEIEVVSALLGHSSVDITRDVYVHILNDRKKKVVQKINEILSVQQKKSL